MMFLSPRARFEEWVCQVSPPLPAWFPPDFTNFDVGLSVLGKECQVRSMQCIGTIFLEWMLTERSAWLCLFLLCLELVIVAM